MCFKRTMNIISRSLIYKWNSSIISSSFASTYSKPAIDFVPIKIEDTERVLKFLRRFYFRDEALCIGINLLETEKDRCPTNEEITVRSIQNGVSLMAITPSEEIVAVSINSIITRDSPIKSYTNTYTCSNKKLAKILKLYDKIEREVNIFEKFPDVNKVFFSEVLSIDTSWRKRGITFATFQKLRVLARKYNCNLWRADCSSYYVSRVMEKCGFECIYSLQYADYKENNKPVFNIEPPHLAYKMYALRLPY